MQSRSLFAAALAVSLAGCAFQAPVAYPGLEGTHWQLVSVTGRTLTLPEAPPIELRFQDSRVNFHGCNALSGRYSQEHDHIIVAKGFVGTKMMCPAELMAVDQAASELFEQGVRFTLYDTTLVLEGGNERWAFTRMEGHSHGPDTIAGS
jgi:heat shock protein HslJ